MALRLAPFEITRVPLPPNLRRGSRGRRRGPVRVHQRGASVGQVASAIRNPVSTVAAGAVVGGVVAVGATAKLSAKVVVWMLAL